MKGNSIDIRLGLLVVQDIDASVRDIPVVVMYEYLSLNTILLKSFACSDGKLSLLLRREKHTGIVPRRECGLVLYCDCI